MRQPSRLSIIMVVGVLLFAGVFAAMAQGESYTVQRGDTLDGIAAFYDVQTSCLAESNNLTRPSELKIGQIININFDCPRYDGLDFVTNSRDGALSGQGGGDSGSESQVVRPGPNDETYVVQRGDTLDTIGQELDVSVVSLRVANDIGVRDVIFPGDILIIPEGSPPYGAYPALVNPEAGFDSQELGQGGGGPLAAPGDEAYVVQPLDTLDTIGAQFDTQVACIAEANGISDASLIYPGQTIVVQTSCPRYDGYDFVPNPRG